MATTWVMTMTVEAIEAAVVGMAISLQGAEGRGRRVTHDNQLNDVNKAAYDVDEHNCDGTYDNNVVSGIAIGWTRARQGRQCQQNNCKDASPTTTAQQRQRGQRDAVKTWVQRGRQRQCNDGNDAITATTPAKRWLRRQRNVGVNTSRTPVKTPMRWWWQHRCNEGNDASGTPAKTPPQCWRHAGSTRVVTPVQQRQRRQQRKQNNSVDTSATRVSTPVKCW
jgi:hypothetical protein